MTSKQKIVSSQQPQSTPDDFLTILDKISMSPYLLGIAYITLQLGGRFLVLSVTPAQEAFLQNIVFRPLLLYAIMFMGTRNLIVAFWLTVVVLILLHYLLNENSDWYLLNPNGFLDSDVLSSSHV